MIHFINAEKFFRTDVGIKRILHPTNLSIPTNRKVGVLGKNGAGKSTLLKMIAGIEKPNSGQIVRKGKVSWPMGLSGGLHPELTGLENIAFLSRLYQTDFQDILKYVEDFSQLDEYLRMPVRQYSSGMKAKLMFGISLALKFDCYLIDELVGVGDRFFREKSKKAFADRTKDTGLLFVSHNEKTVQEYCDLALVLYDGYMVPFNDVNEGIDFYLSHCLPSL